MSSYLGNHWMTGNKTTHAIETVSDGNIGLRQGLGAKGPCAYYPQSCCIPGTWESGCPRSPAGIFPGKVVHHCMKLQPCVPCEDFG